MSKKSKVVIPELPEHLWFEILLKAPNEDVAKYRCLSKFHQNLIDSIEFTQKHNDLSIKTGAMTSHVIISGRDGHSHPRIDYRVVFRSSNSIHVHRLIPPIQNHKVLMGCCKGILWYLARSLSTDSLVLWNSLTGFSRTISPKPTQSKDLKHHYTLGHDVVTNDFKVLKIQMHSCITIVDCEIYSLKTDSWTQITVKDYVNGIQPYQWRPVLAESINSMCWLYEKDILAYNLSTQKFNKFPLPKIKANRQAYLNGYLDVGISSVDGCLCVCMVLNQMFGCVKDEEKWSRGILESTLFYP